MTTKNNNTSPEVKEAMKTRPAYIRTTLAAAALLTAACDVDMYEREICTYTVQLQYRYNEENTSSDNRIVYWVQHIDEYIFDGDGVLCSIRRVTEPMCDEHLNSEMQLEAGRYTVIAVGNADDQSLVYDSGNGRVEPVIGVTRRENLHMSLHEPEVYPSGRSGPCEELFYGYATFTVREIGATRVSVDVINAHFQVRYTVRWKTPPVSSTRAEVDYGTYYAVVDEIPSVYHLMPEYLYDQGSFDYTEHDPDRHDDYPVEDRRVTHYIPHAAYDDLNPHTHGNLTYMNADRQVSGQFVHYRVKNDTDPHMTLYYAPTGSPAEGDPMVLPRPISLRGFTEWYGIDLDGELKQEYELNITVDGDRMIIELAGGLGISDWTDGGRLM